MSDFIFLESNLQNVLERSSSMSVNDIQLSISSINEYCSSIEGLIYLINNYSRFEFLTSKKLTFIVCKNWCQHKWDEIPTNLKESLKSFLFIKVIENSDNLTVDFQNVIGDAQVSFMWKSYLNEWPTFWNDILKLPPPFVLNFLNAFSSMTSTFLQDSNQEFTKIKQTIRSQELDKLIIKYLFNCLNANPPLTLSLIAYFAHWVSLDTILNDDAMSVIVKAIDNEPTASPALNVLNSIIERGMDASMKIQIIDTLQIPSRIIGLICGGANNDILYSAAQLVENAGSFLISTPKSIPFFQISLQFLTSLDNEISGCVAPFIQQYTKNNPDVAPIVMNASYSRLKEYYSFNILDYGTEDQAYCEMLYGIIRACFQVNHDDSLNFLISICDSMDIIEEMPHCVALIEVLNDQQPQPEFVQYFEPLLSLKPPLSPHQSKALGSYIRFFTSVASSFNEQTISLFFSRIATFALCPMVHEETRSLISLSLLAFTKKYKNIQFDPSLIFEFVQTIDPNLITLAAILISRLQNNQFEIFQSCILHLTSKLQNDFRFCSLVLHFIKAIKYKNNSPHIPIVLNFLMQIAPLIKSNDQLQAQFIRTCFYSLGPESCGLINECIPHCIEPLSIAALSDVSQTAVKFFQSIEFAINLSKHMLKSFIVCFNQIDDWSIINDNNNEIIKMVDDFLRLFISIYPHLKTENVNLFENFKINNIQNLDDILNSPDSTPTFVQSIIQFIINTLSPKYFCYQLYVKIYSFISHLSKYEPKFTLQAFGDITISSLLSNPNFHPTHPGWSKVIQKLGKFQSTILQDNSEVAIQIIAKAFMSMNATEQIIQSYIEILHLTPRQRNERIITFLGDFMRYKRSIL